MPALARLEEELRFAPREVILRVVERLEAMGDDISPQGDYPDDWVVHRLTGYRPDKTSDQLTPGGALLAGLSPMSERLCEHVALAQREVPDGMTAAAVLERWHISPQTLTRLRKQGLVARRVAGEVGRAQLAFRRGVVEAFEAAHRESLAKAAGFSKLSRRDTRWAVRAAPRYRAWAGLSAQGAAVRIATKLGRATETIRGLLAREGLGATRGGRRVSQRALWRAWRWGAAPKALAREVRRSPGVVRRDVSLARLGHLRSVILQPAQGHTPRSAPSVLEVPAVYTGLGQPGPATPARFIAMARAGRPPVMVEERARLGAFHELRSRASVKIMRLNTLQPQPGMLDDIETDLRWAARLAAALLHAQLRTIVSALEGRLERPLESLPPALVLPMLLESLRAAGAAMEAIDPAKGARVAGGVGLAVDRVGVRFAKAVGTATPPRPAANEFPPDWTLRIFPWQRFFEPDPRLRDAMAREHVSPQDRAILAGRFGLGGAPPRTIVALAKDFDMSERRTAIELSRAMLGALAPLRGPAYPAQVAGRTLNA